VDVDIGFDADGATDPGDDVDVMELADNDEDNVDKVELVVDCAEDIDGVLVADESLKQETATSSLCPQL